MKKTGSTIVGKWRNATRIRYAQKRLSSNWKRRKFHKKNHQSDIQSVKYRLARNKVSRRGKKPYINVLGPENFSLINNTNEALKFFSEAEVILKNGNNVKLNIDNTQILTADAIALMVANINNEEFLHGGRVSGEAPKKSDLKKIFMESGFYDHVSARSGFAKKSEGDLLFKKLSKIPEPIVAYEAAKLGKEHVFGSDIIFDLLYDVMLECMSNTHDHADNEKDGEYNWWLYTHNYPNQCRTGFTFVDLGVGIFKSVHVEGFFRRRLKGSPMLKNVDIVPELLAGKIRSRKQKDKEIRGKGIPEIVDAAKHEYFSQFWLIANNVKINLKTGKAEELKYSLDGTLFYWELTR